MKNYVFADLFSGCGGLSLGLTQAGLVGRFAIERDEMAFRTFAANLIDKKGAASSFSWPSWLEKKAWDIEELLELHLRELTN